MLQQSENTDDEDDYEGYFLQPSCNYNIAEKIIEANKELFSQSIPSSPLPEEQRRVKFREVLEDFGPSEFYADDGNGELIMEENCLVEYREDEDHENNNSDYVLDNDISEEEIKVSTDEVIEEICEDIEELDVVTENSSNIDIISVDENSSECMPIESNIEIINVVSNELASNNYEKSYKIVKKQNKTPERLQSPSSSRSCCRHKHLENDKLPKYNGFKSQYGLSKEQLERREKKLEELKRREMRKSMEHIEKNRTKTQQNEEIYALWLHNKIKNPVNKTKNMFDFAKLKKKS